MPPRNRKKVKHISRSFAIIFYHIATISNGCMYLLLFTIFQPIIDSLYYGSSMGVEGIIKSVVSWILSNYKTTYDTINGYGFYVVGIYGADYYTAMAKSNNLKKVGEKNLVTLVGDSFIYVSILFISASTLAFGMALDPFGPMRWWKNIILQFVTGLWVSMSFLLTFKHMNSAFYVCVCMDYEKNKGSHKYPSAFINYLKQKQAFGLAGRLKFQKSQRRKSPILKKEQIVDEPAV